MSEGCAPRTARSTSARALLLRAVVSQPAVVLVSLPCRSWSVLKVEDRKSILRAVDEALRPASHAG